MSKGKVVFCTPSLAGPTRPYLASLEASIPLIVGAGWEEGYAQQIACPYISAARANMLRAALDAKADVIVFIDYDVSWRPHDLLKLIETEGDVVAGTYRAKIDDVQFMGTIETTGAPDHLPLVRESDGAIMAKLVPAGFLKITKNAVDHFMSSYPELCYGPNYHLSVDLFNHGVRDRIWWGEDYAFSQRWRATGNDIWLVPDLELGHHAFDRDGTHKVYAGNFHRYLLSQPGGSEDPGRQPTLQAA